MHLSRSTLLLTFLSLTPAMAQKITVYPGAATIAKGTSRQMTGYVQLSPNTVSWSINGVLGGNSTFGTVSQTGLYQAPAEVPTPNLITIRVASKAYPNEVGTAQISITQPQPNVWSIYPGKLSAGAVAFSVNGSNFIPGVVVTINGQPLNTVFKSSTSLTVTGNIPASMAGNAVLLAVNPAPGSTTSPAIRVPIQVSSISVSVSPQSASVAVNASQAFTANLPVTWSASVGSISSTGIYTAPASLPNPPTALIRATSTADPSVSATAAVTLTQPSVTVKLTPANIQLTLGGKQQFTVEPNLAVTWTATAGSISTTGLYTAPASMPNPATVTIRATTVAQPSVSGQAMVTLQSPPQPMPNLSHARFLDQAAFGPTPYELQKLSQSTIQAWLQEQFNMPETPLPIPASNSAASAEYISRLVHAPDQLRQRVVNALTKVIVVSANKNPYPEEVVPYLQILSRHAFGSYRQMLYDITVSPQMGKYLDLANSKKASPNENYPRELMQLFTTGLVLLNPDGTPKLDAQGKTIPAYDQSTVVATSKALTGWTYPTPAGGSMGVSNWESFNAPAMEAREQFHDTTAKTLIGGCTIPAGLTVAAETNRVIDCVFNHPNTAPFIVTRLIRDLVMSNPSP
ncbi:MAG: DUF1800 family protein, partial [Acidobacteria bacterium]|nr:DUF1800 family protein [Acidobacteriota bacterium]